MLAYVFMQTSIAQQAGDFSVEEVIEHIARKLVRRHPHVYDDVDTDGPEKIERIWEQIKAQERAERDARQPTAARAESALDSVPTFTPSFVRSDQLIDRAERVGFGAPPESAREQLAVAITALEDPPGAAAVGALLWARRSPRTRRRDRHGTGLTPRRKRLHRVLQSG